MFRSRPCGMPTGITDRNRPLKSGEPARPSQQFLHAWKYVLRTACAACAGRTARKSRSLRAWRIAASAFAGDLSGLTPDHAKGHRSPSYVSTSSP